MCVYLFEEVGPREELEQGARDRVLVSYYPLVMLHEGSVYLRRVCGHRTST